MTSVFRLTNSLPLNLIAFLGGLLIAAYTSGAILTALYLAPPCDPRERNTINGNSVCRFSAADKTTANKR